MRICNLHCLDVYPRGIYRNVPCAHFFSLFLSYLPFSFLARGLLTHLLSLQGWLHKGLPSFFQSRPLMPN